MGVNVHFLTKLVKLINVAKVSGTKSTHKNKITYVLTIYKSL